jgi:hypothetical protein
MRQIVWTAALVCLIAAAPLRADEATALLDRAIKAQGGEEKLKAAQSASFKTKGTVTAGGMQVDLAGDAAVQGDGLYRWNVTFSAMGRTESGVIVVTPEKIWGKGGNQANAEEAPAEAAFLRDVFRTIRLPQNLAVLRNQDTTLSHLGELKIEERAAVGLKVATKGRPEIDLFFDKETHLPLRAEIRVKEPGEANEIVYAFIFADYKDVNGVKMYGKFTLKRDDKVTLVMEFSDFQLQEKLGADLFAKP